VNKAIKINRKQKNTFKGKIFFFNDLKFKNFNLQRFFIITSNKKKEIRGMHAHKKCDQILILTNGQAKIKIFKNSTKIFNLKKNDAIYLPKKHWVEIYFLKQTSSILVLCNCKFNLKEYIFDKKLI
tara:strand:- start:969 stop:1346 length:378 start_codon:yes stop_codon:yes gene_type:complete